MPLALFPDWLARFSKLTPFGASVYVPIEIFLGTVQGAAMLQSLLVQAAWVVILVLIDYIVLSLGVRKLVIQGG
jgi:ABC-2 type transport system permease protein